VSPYYLETGGGLTVTQALGASWDVVGRAARTALAYRQLAGAPSGRVDHVTTIGVGMGRHFATNVRMGIDIARIERRSTREHSYRGFTAGGSVTYGF
jgi:hypothetical protein